MVSDEKVDELFPFGLGMILGEIFYGLYRCVKDEKNDEDNRRE